MTERERDHFYLYWGGHYTKEMIDIFIRVQEIFSETWRGLLADFDPDSLMQVFTFKDFVKKDVVIAGAGTLPSIAGKIAPEMRYNVESFSVSDSEESIRAKAEAQAIAIYEAYKRHCKGGIAIAYLDSKKDPDIFVHSMPTNYSVYAKKAEEMQIKFRFEYGVMYPPKQ